MAVAAAVVAVAAAVVAAASDDESSPLQAESPSATQTAATIARNTGRDVIDRQV